MTNVLPFKPSHGRKTYRPEFGLFENKKRRQWVVIERSHDGTETYITVAHGRKSEAVWRANLYTQIEAKRQSDIALLARDPLGKALLAMSPEERQRQIRLLSAVQQLLAPDCEQRA